MRIPSARGLTIFGCIRAGCGASVRASGITILTCVALAAASNLLPASVNAHWPFLLIFEAVAVFAFGVSWFVEGQTIQALRAHRHHPETDGSQVTEPSGAML
jgi:hypothetical protein